MLLMWPSLSVQHREIYDDRLGILLQLLIEHIMLDCTIRVKKNKKPIKGAVVQVTHRGENHNVFGKTDINGELKIQVFSGLYEVKVINGDDVYKDIHSLYTAIPLTIKFK